MEHIQEQGDEIMKRIFWDVILDSNIYRTFTTGWEVNKRLEFRDVFKSSQKFGNSWNLIKLELWEGEYAKREKKKPVADFMNSGLAIKAVSQSAKEVLESLILEQVEFLPFDTPVGKYYGLHVNYVDCLDLSKVTAKYFSDGRVMRVVKYAFYWEKLEGIHIFRLPELGLSRLFVSDEFKQTVEKNKLTGLMFYPIPLVEE
jgi:hypothetical protein